MSQLNNVNFDLLLKAHNGNVDRAKLAWQQICRLGRFGDVPVTYAGGVDVRSLRTLIDEQSQRQYTALQYDVHTKEPITPADVNPDNLKKVEDIAAGDNPHKFDQ